MDREIKFRAWDATAKEMSRVLMLWPGDQGHGLQYQLTNGNIVLSTTAAKEGVAVMQFTGLRDKNGKEIYEGDIVFLNHTFRNHPEGNLQDNFITVVIEYSNGAFWFTGGGFTDCNWHHYPEKDRLVIGNVFKNPDLVTKGIPAGVGSAESSLA